MDLPRLLRHGQSITHAVAVFLCCLTIFVFSVFRPKRRLPPGPKGLPIIGNVHQIPTETPWQTFADWAKIYGDVISLNVMGKTMIVLNSRKAANDLLVKRSLVYSDRPRLIFASEMVGYNKAFGLQNISENWRKSRQFVAQDFGPSVVSRYWNLQERATGLLVQDLMNSPDSLVPRVKWRIGSIIFRIVYGYPVEDESDALLHLGFTFMNNFGKAATAGNFLVDFIPALQYVPLWMPGAGFFKTAEDYRKTYFNACYKPFEWCENNLTTGKVLFPNLCASVIDTDDLGPEDRERLVFSANGVMGAGLESSMSMVLTFLRAMVQHPDIQEKAHQEIDSVIGCDRLPSIADRPKLPYITRILAEVFRYGPPGPLGIPHSLTEDDVYDGKFIPKGSMVVANIWHMHRDPDIFSNPDEFDPDRFVGKDEELQRVIALTFGFGRRVCPGIYFAEGTLFAMIAMTLATCHVLPGLDKEGNEVWPSNGYTTGIAALPHEFSLRLVPRSAHASALLADISGLSN